MRLREEVRNLKYEIDRLSHEIKQLKERVSRLEHEPDSDEDYCETCGLELIECTAFSANKRRMMCPKCGSYKLYDYETR